MAWKEYDISASRIKKHASCPEKYRLRYIAEKESTKMRQGYGEIGSLVHESIENVLNNHPNERNKNALTSRLKQEFYQLEESGEYDMELIDDRQRSTGLDCLEMAAKWLAKPGQDVEFREIEAVCHYDLDGLDRTAIGFMDVATQNGIWDWKTGRIRGDETERDEIIQGAVYMGGYHNSYGELPEYIKFVYLKEEKVRTVTPGEEAWEEMLEYARELVKSEQTDTYEPDPEEGKCYFCGWENFCSASAVSPGQIQEEIDNGKTEMWNAI